MVILFQPLSDGSWQGIPVEICTMAEASTYLISACLLQIRPLLTFLFRETPLRRIRHWAVTQTRAVPHENSDRKTSHWTSGINLSLQKLDEPESDDRNILEQHRDDAIVITNEFTVAYERGVMDEDHANQFEIQVPTRPSEHL
jgi:hypothetical protein